LPNYFDMRKLMIIALLLTGNITFAQNKDTVGLNTPVVNGMVVYQKNFKTSGKSTATLFNNSRTWFEKRYNGLDSVKVQDSVNGQLVGQGWEKLAFKGPLGMEVANRAGMKIDIISKSDGYEVRISNIVLGYMEDPGLPRIYFSAEDLMDKVLGVKFNNENGYNPTPFNKKRSKKALESLNLLMNDMMLSINEVMDSK
jgi:hypothetical protein